MSAPETGTERSVPLTSAAEQVTPRDKVAEKNMELMQTLDDAWNEQNVEVFRARHKPDVIVRWPGNPKPTVGIEDHTQEAYDFWKSSRINASPTGRTGSSSRRATSRARLPV